MFIPVCKYIDNHKMIEQEPKPKPKPEKEKQEWPKEVDDDYEDRQHY